jgi:hypothetical protein
MTRAAKAQTSKPEMPDVQEPRDEPTKIQPHSGELVKSERDTAGAKHAEPNDAKPKDVEQNKVVPKSTEEKPATEDTTNVEKAVALGKEMMKQGSVTKADVARKMYELIHEEPRDVIVQAFVDGAGLTPKGAMTYFYNCKRKRAKR